MTGPVPGPSNSLVDVPGLRVGHVTLRGDGYLTGTTVVLAPPAGVVAGVDVRGNAPGTRETDLLEPRRMVERVHALTLSGGSAYGLAAADGVMRGLAADRVGFPLGDEPDHVVPIVPAAVVFDLNRGGRFDARPDAATGLAAYRAAAGADGGGPVPLGAVGAGTGAAVGGLKGGIGSASAVLAGGAVVAALVVLNAAGSPADPRTGELYGARFGLAGEFDGLRTPTAAEVAAAAEAGLPRAGVEGPLRATTLAVLATDLTLTKAQCQLLAGMGAGGLARAVRPVHTMVDGDLTFGVSTCARPTPEQPALHELLAQSADCVSRAVVRAALAVTGVRTDSGHWPSYAELFPSALG
ncbi:MAG TPA: P1 family peptidase [Pseudonocardia sp.]